MTEKAQKRQWRGRNELKQEEEESSFERENVDSVKYFVSPFEARRTGDPGTEQLPPMNQCVGTNPLGSERKKNLGVGFESKTKPAGTTPSGGGGNSMGHKGQTNKARNGRTRFKRQKRARRVREARERSEEVEKLEDQMETLQKRLQEAETTKREAARKEAEAKQRTGSGEESKGSRSDSI